ncbi:DUF2809 domain-containing protein [Acetobacter malorum]|uniref:ribosomal maturation YjgA family protein n=1 Tax=Acetobacter malorum TaxID=178901 RepID=UPI0039E7444A
MRISLLTLAVILAGVAVRKLPLGLPFFVTKWSGSWLWGMMMWCAVSLLFSSRHPVRNALLALVLASMSEGLKFLHTPTLDHFRSNALGSFLLGHHFSLTNIGVYALAILATAYGAGCWQRRTPRNTTPPPAF